MSRKVTQTHPETLFLVFVLFRRFRSVDGWGGAERGFVTDR